jgi:hypothetical protein
MVANVGPTVSKDSCDRADFVSWYSHFRGPEMPSLNRVREAIGNLGEDDIQRLNRYQHEEKIYQSEVESSNRRPMVMPHIYGLRLFTTHNGRLGFIGADYDLRDRTKILRFSKCDVAWLYKIGTAGRPTVDGRLLIIKSDRSMLKAVSADDAAYRYAVPGPKESIKVCDKFQHADIGEGINYFIGAGEVSSRVSMTISELQFWTW